MINRLKFDENYTERVTCRDGTLLQLRLVRPSDKERLLRGFAELSAQSRYRRFFVAKNSLSEEELRFFTETDCIDHFALGAVMLEPRGTEGRGVGISRFIRTRDDPWLAEVAITVVDDMQRRGVGLVLLERLIEAAQERDVRRFRFECLAQNRNLQKLIQRVCREVKLVDEGEIMVAEVDLPGCHHESQRRSKEALTNLRDLLRAMARQALEAQVAFGFDSATRTLDAAHKSGELWLRPRRPRPPNEE